MYKYIRNCSSNRTEAAKANNQTRTNRDQKYKYIIRIYAYRFDWESYKWIIDSLQSWQY